MTVIMIFDDQILIDVSGVEVRRVVTEAWDRVLVGNEPAYFRVALRVDGQVLADTFLVV